jgi:GR25 family glycosyltransferase involved in LPS biosynthesis
VDVDQNKLFNELSHKFLNDGMLSGDMRASEAACAAAHLSAYENIINGNDKCALVIEDDIILPEEINDILFELERNIKENEVALLYSANLKKVEYSSLGQEKLSCGNLIYPMKARYLRTTAAYVIGRKVAEAIYNMNRPVRYRADSWNAFFHETDMEKFNKIRLLYPVTVRLECFESSLGYTENSLIERVKKIGNKFSAFNALLRIKRKVVFWRRRNNIHFVERLSPIMPDSRSSSSKSQ